MLLLSHGGHHRRRRSEQDAREAPRAALSPPRLTQASWRRTGGPCSLLRAPGPHRRAAAQRPPPRLLRLGWRTLTLKPPLPPPSRPPSRDAVGPRRVTAAPRGPEAPGAAALPPAGDGRSRSPMAGRQGWRAASAPPGPLGRAGAPGQQAAAPRTAAFGVWALGIGLRAKLGGRLPGASDLLASSLEKKCATDGWRQENNRGEGARAQRQGSPTRTSVGAQVCSEIALRPNPEAWRRRGPGLQPCRLHR